MRHSSPCSPNRQRCRVPREPAWWYGAESQNVAACLQPVALLYGAAAAARMRIAVPYRSKLPVICAGNFTAGGTGKTPLALHLAERLKANGEKPVFLTRGYGGLAKGPMWVHATRHSAIDAGDEAMLLLRSAPVMVSRDRRAGAVAIEAARDASVIIMDDGLQNPSLAKDVTIAVVDAERRFGNGRVIPAGPLRAPLAFQMRLCHAIVLGGTGAAPASAADFDKKLRETFTGPILHSRIEPRDATPWLRNANVVAYAGIGHPQRFFDLLERLGATLVDRQIFADHQRLTDENAKQLLARAGAANAVLVTTEKDLARLPDGNGPLGNLKRTSRVLAVRSVFDAADQGLLDGLIYSALAARRR